MRKLMIVGLFSLVLAFTAPFGADARNGSGGHGGGGGGGGHSACNEVVDCATAGGGGGGGVGGGSGSGGSFVCLTPPGTGEQECRGSGVSRP